MQLEGLVIHHDRVNDQTGYDLDGYQILLNYRRAEPIEFCMKEFVSSEESDDCIKRNDRHIKGKNITKEDIKDSVVIIGYTDIENNDDLHITPYNSHNKSKEKMPGVYLHAHMTSQIISAASSERRPLINSLYPQSFETLWILILSLISGFLIWLVTKINHLAFLVLALLTLTLSIYIFSISFFFNSVWVPFATPLITSWIIFLTYSLIWLSIKSKVND